MNLSEIKEQFAGYNACYFCAGVSSVGKNEEEYIKLTYDLTINFAKTLLNDEMILTYVSGSGTDSSEKGKLMWARVKGKTENDLLKLGFKNAFMYRPGYIQPIKGMKNTYKIYKFLTPFYSIFESLFPKFVISLDELANSMINVTINGYAKNVLENEDIRRTAKN